MLSPLKGMLTLLLILLQTVLFSMDDVLKQKIDESLKIAKKNKSRLVIQGMIQNSMVKTAKFVEEIGFPVDIDPPLFKHYAVTHVPVFLERKDQKTVLMSGNVTPQFAFQKLSENGEAS